MVPRLPALARAVQVPVGERTAESGGECPETVESWLSRVQVRRTELCLSMEGVVEGRAELTGPAMGEVLGQEEERGRPRPGGEACHIERSGAGRT